MAISLGFLPKDLRKALMPFQKEGIRYGILKKGRCLIGDEMGLGKTLQALSIAYYYKDDWPLLIIVPSSMKYPWVDELEKWLPEIPPEDINLIKSSSDVAAVATSKINIISYGLISLRSRLNALLLDAIKKSKFGVTIVDESHYIKNRQTSRTQKIAELLKTMKRVILLTGTPSLARPEELFVQVNIIQPGIVGNWYYFGERYCDGRYILQPTRGGKMLKKYDTRGASNLKELHEILKNNVMIRRLKSEVLTELPAKRRQRIRFDIATDSERKKTLETSRLLFMNLMKKYKKQFSEVDDEGFVTMTDVNGAFTQLFSATGLAKAGAVQEYVSELIDAMPNKFVVFCFHLKVIDAVTELLAKRNTRYIRIAGDVPSELRADYVNEFQTNPNCRVAVLSITAACTGLTLTAADHVVFAELHLTPGIIKQAEDRCHRIGQKNAVQIHFLTASKTIDDILWSMLSRKLQVTSETLDGETQEMTAEETDDGISQLLSLCEAWFPDEDDEADDVDLFTPRDKKAESNRQDIRSLFAQSSGKKKRKVRNYYEKGMVDISESSDDNEEFKSHHKRSKRPRKDKGDISCTNSNGNIAVIVLLDDNEGQLDQKSEEAGFKHGSSLRDIVATNQKSMGIKTCTQLSPNTDEATLKLKDHDKASFDENINDCHRLAKTSIAKKWNTVDSASETQLDESNLQTGISASDREIHTEEKFNSTTPGKSDVPDIITLVISSTETSPDIPKEKINAAASPSNSSTVRDIDALNNDCPSPSDANKSWNCIACTFENHEDLNMCEICDTSKPMSRVSTRSLAVDINIEEFQQYSKKIKWRNSRKTTGSINNFDAENFVGESCQQQSADDDIAAHAEHAFADMGNSINHSVSNSLPVRNTLSSVNSLINLVIETQEPTDIPQAGIVSSTLSKNKENENLEPLQLISRAKTGATGTEEKKALVDFDIVENSSQVHRSLTGESLFTNEDEDPASGASTKTDSSSDISFDWFDNSLDVNCDLDTGFDEANVSLGKRNKEHNDGSAGSDMRKSVGKNWGNFVRGGLLNEDSKRRARNFHAMSPSLFNSSEDSDGETKTPKRTLQGFRTASQLLNQDEDGCGQIKRCYDGGNVMSTPSRDTRESLVVKEGTLSDEDSDATRDSSKQGFSFQRKSEGIEISKNACDDGKRDKIKMMDVTANEDNNISGFLLDAAFDEEIPIVAYAKSESESEPEEQEEVQPVQLMFKTSFESDRMYIYDENERFLGINLRIPDTGVFNPEDLPRIFSNPYNLKQLKKFVREWSSLTATKQRMIRKKGVVFKSPLEAYDELRKTRYGNPSYDRFTTKEQWNDKVKAVADNVGGTVTKVKERTLERYLKKSAGATKEDSSGGNSKQNEGQTLLQAVDAEGVPLCLFCNAKVTIGKAGTPEAKFCSYGCQEEYLVRTCSSSVVRERLFRSEKGVCQICKFNAHDLFVRIAALRKKDRKAAIQETNFVNLPPEMLNKIIADPKEGKFWEADHIDAVSEGGGECGLDNYRTLCVPCHRDVTKDLNKRLRKKRKLDRARADGNMDIGNYFTGSNGRSISNERSNSSKASKSRGTATCSYSTRDRKNVGSSTATSAVTSARTEAGLID